MSSQALYRAARTHGLVFYVTTYSKLTNLALHSCFGDKWRGITVNLSPKTGLTAVLPALRVAQFLQYVENKRLHDYRNCLHPRLVLDKLHELPHVRVLEQLLEIIIDSALFAQESNCLKS